MRLKIDTANRRVTKMPKRPQQVETARWATCVKSQEHLQNIHSGADRRRNSA